MSVKPIYKEEFFLSASDADAEARLSLAVLTSKIIDIATMHANILGIGNPSMQHLHAGWILSRLTLGMADYPDINSHYVIKTWIEDFNRHFSTRCFSIESPEGKIYGYARSIWLVLDYANHTNFGTTHLNLPEGCILGQSVPIARQEKHITILTPDSPKPSNKIYLIANRPPFHHIFRYCDLDYYRHVNTVRYVSLLLNQFTLEEHDETLIERLELSFLHEASYGMETILLRYDEPQNPFNSSFLLTDSSTSAPLLFARIKRRKSSYEK